MHELHEIRDRLVDKLIDVGHRELTDSSLETIDTLAHAAKNVCKIIESCDGDEHSSRMSRRSYEPESRRATPLGGRYGIERGRERPSYGGHEHVEAKLEELMEMADDGTRRTIEKALRELRG